MTKEIHRLSCPVCQTDINFSFAYNLEFVDVKCDAIVYRPSLFQKAGEKEILPYKPDLPLCSWFRGFFPALDSSGAEVGLTDGHVILFRKDLPGSFFMSQHQEPKNIPDSLLSVPAEVLEVRPQTIHGRIEVQMADLDGKACGDYFMPRPSVDLAFWLCPEVKFFQPIDSKHKHIFYMTNTDGLLFMVASGIKQP